jgi:hypothetical protein
VRLAYADLSLKLGSATFNVEYIVDFYISKYNLTCPSSSLSWCLLAKKR